MHLATTDAAYALLAAIGLSLLFRLWINKRSRYSVPPGPRGYPLLGNIRDIPPMPTWVTYRQWSDKYGSPILRLNVLGQNIIILNTLKAVLDLLEKRSAIYSDRPNFTMMNELCGLEYSLGSMRYGPYWRTQRRMIHSQFHSRVSGRLRPIEEKATHRFLGHLLETPDDFFAHARLLAGSQIGEMAFGLKVKSPDDPYLKMAEETMAAVRAVMSAGAYLVDLFPFLKHIPAWFPGATFQRQAREWRISILEVLDAPFAQYKERCEAGDVPDCMATSLLEDMQRHEDTDASYTEEDVKAVLAVMYAAGSDTTLSTVLSFMLAVIFFPEVQSKAQAEIDAVCPNRLPTFDDLGALPYIQATVNEALRWNPVVPESDPHAVIEDDVYEGYFIPKGSIVVPNSWAILHEEEFYPDPFKFNPDRFLKDGALDPNVLSPDVAAFGYGRRVCPGRFMARDSVWIAIACILAVFDIQPAKDQDGRPLMPSGEYINGFVCLPKPFKCEIRPRSPQHKALIAATLQSVE